MQNSRLKEESSEKDKVIEAKNSEIEAKNSDIHEHEIELERK